MRSCCLVGLLTLIAGLGLRAEAADAWGLEPGTVELKSVGPLAVGPDGILFAADPQAATIYALGTGDKKGDAAAAKFDVGGLEQQIAKALGTTADKVVLEDLAVNPATGNIFLSVNAGKPALLKLGADGVVAISLKEIPHRKAVLPNPPPEQPAAGKRYSRADSITDLVYSQGKLLVAGMTADDAPSTIRELTLPFADSEAGVKIEIYHAAHGKYENYAAVRSFVPLTIDGQPSVLAGFTCTPLVKFPLEGIRGEKSLRGTTVAELGNRNKPLDMIVYERDGKNYLLMANSARGVMKVSLENIEKNEGLTTPVGGGGTAGQPFESLKELEGVVQLDRLNEDHAVLVSKSSTGALHLQTIALP